MYRPDRYVFAMKQNDGTTISVSGDKEHLKDIMGDIRLFLLACTFSEELVDLAINSESLE